MLFRHKVVAFLKIFVIKASSKDSCSIISIQDEAEFSWIRFIEHSVRGHHRSLSERSIASETLLYFSNLIGSIKSFIDVYLSFFTETRSFSDLNSKCPKLRNFLSMQKCCPSFIASFWTNQREPELDTAIVRIWSLCLCVVPEEMVRVRVLDSVDGECLGSSVRRRRRSSVGAGVRVLCVHTNLTFNFEELRNRCQTAAWSMLKQPVLCWKRRPDAYRFFNMWNFFSLRSEWSFSLASNQKFDWKIWQKSRVYRKDSIATIATKD